MLKPQCCFPFHRASLKCVVLVTVRPWEPCSTCCVHRQRRQGNLLNPLEVPTLALKHKRSTWSSRYASHLLGSVPPAAQNPTYRCTVKRIFLWWSQVHFFSWRFTADWAQIGGRVIYPFPPPASIHHLTQDMNSSFALQGVARLPSNYLDLWWQE